MARTRLTFCDQCLLAIFVVIMGGSCSAAAEENVTATPNIEQRVERIIDGLRPAVDIAGEAPKKLKLIKRMNDLHVPGVSIAVIHGGAVEWARGFGVAAIGGSPVESETLFQAGSISKPVSAVAALALVQAGKLDLDADVNLALKSWKIPANPYTDEAKVTLRRLLNHSAGITVDGFPGYPADGPVPSLVDVLDGTPPANTAPIRVDTPPGKQFRYSGGGYTIMQQLLIDVAGKPFPDLLEETVLKPFGMTHSHFHQPLPPGDTSMSSTPYRVEGTPVPGGPHTYPELAAAGLWTTPTDLARFALALQNAWAGRDTLVLSQSTASQMLTPGLGDYGLGPIVRGSPPQRRFLHEGINDGFVNSMIAFESGDGAVVMTNGIRGRQLAREIMASIAVEYHWPYGQPITRQRTTVSPQLLERLAGTYELSPAFRIMISSKGDRLFAQSIGQPRFEIFPQSDRDFFYTTIDAVITFDTDGQANAGQLTLHQNGADLVGKRVP